MGLLTCVLKQIPDSYGNDETTFEKRETNPLDVPLDDIAEDLLSFLNESKSLSGAKEDIEKKYEIKKEDGDCWPADDIKRVWGQTQSMKIKSSRRRYWAHVIIFQMLKRFMVYDERKPNAAQKDHDDTTNETKHSCETRSGMKENSEDTSSQGKAELETAGAAGGVEQMLGAERKLSKVFRSAESDSGVASGSPLSASSTDEAPSPTEVNPITSSSNSETRNAALVNEDEDTLNNNCEQRKDEDNYELCYADVHDKENARCKNGLRSACGISQRMKGNAEHRSTQSNAEPQQTEQTKDTAKQQSGADSGATKRKSTESGATKRKSTDNAESESLLSTSGERDDSKEVPKRRSLRIWSREVSNKANSQTVYLRIPFSVMAGNESPSSIDTVDPDVSPNYKLIDRVPKLTEIRKRKSYAMLYDNRTRNAAWVYEILNSETLQTKVDRANVFSADQSIHPFYRESNVLYLGSYDRGHLAAAANHRWCRKACDDTFLMSNISPQHQDLNNGCWKTLENDCQTLAEETNIRNVHVYSGPLYLPGDNQKILVKKIRGQVVPTHFFKVIIVEHKDRKVEHEDGKVEHEDGKVEHEDGKVEHEDGKVEHEDGKVELKCYVMPNDASGDKYTVSIEDIERASGLIFREKCCSEGETESLRRVTWTGENEYDEPCTVTTHVNISTPRA